MSHIRYKKLREWHCNSPAIRSSSSLSLKVPNDDGTGFGLLFGSSLLPLLPIICQSRITSQQRLQCGVLWDRKTLWHHTAPGHGARWRCCWVADTPSISPFARTFSFCSVHPVHGGRSQSVAHKTQGSPLCW